MGLQNLKSMAQLVHSRIVTLNSSDLCQYTQMRNDYYFFFLSWRNKENIMYIWVTYFLFKVLWVFFFFFQFGIFCLPFITYSLKSQCVDLYSAVIYKCKISSPLPVLMVSSRFILRAEFCSVWVFPHCFSLAFLEQRTCPETT